MEILWTFSIYLESVAILPNFLWYRKLARQNPLHHIIYSHWAHIEHSIFSTGSTDTISRASMISLLLWLDAFKPFCTAISSISISPRFLRARSYNFQLKNANNNQGFIRKQRGHATIFT